MSFTKQSHHRYLIYHELNFIDALLYGRVLDSILATPIYNPAMRKVSLAQLFRAELLKTLRYAEMSCRNYCRLMINQLEHKTVRSFAHLASVLAAIAAHHRLAGKEKRPKQFPLAA